MVRKRFPKRSGHGDEHVKRLSPRQVERLNREGRIFITIQGVRKRVTPCNVYNTAEGKVVKWYRRSDTKSISLRNWCSDVHRKKAAARNRSGRGFEGDSRYLRRFGGWV